MANAISPAAICLGIKGNGTLSPRLVSEMEDSSGAQPKRGKVLAKLGGVGRCLFSRDSRVSALLVRFALSVFRLPENRRT